MPGRCCGTIRPFRKRLYRKHGISLRVWVSMKLGVRNMKHKVNHKIHPEHRADAEENHSDTEAEASGKDTDSGDNCTDK